MEIREQVALAPYTTFRIGGPARYFAAVSNEKEIATAVSFAKKQELPLFILGGGSNILVPDTGFPGLVIHPQMTGISVADQDQTHVRLHVAAGELWDDFVAYAVMHGYWGIENLSLIPGSAGASAVQNIGAYGQEAKDTITSVEAYDSDTDKFVSFLNDGCGFSYRRSIFNHQSKGRFIITAITFSLKKQGEPLTTYPDVIRYFQDKTISKPTLQDMRQAIIAIRKRKLPDPREIGNAGSFFKNPHIDSEAYLSLIERIAAEFDTFASERLQALTSKMNPHLDLSSRSGLIKIPAAFLIELCGLKGCRIGGAQISDRHALIIINASGSATANDVIALFEHTRDIVNKRTGIVLSHEPEFVGSVQ